MVNYILDYMSCYIMIIDYIKIIDYIGIIDYIIISIDSFCILVISYNYLIEIKFENSI